MTRFSQLFSSCAIAFNLSVGAAYADLTAAEVWADWEQLITATGYSVSAQKASTPTSIIISDLSIIMDIADASDEGTFALKMDTLSFIESGDGSVAIEVPSKIEGTLKFTPKIGESVSVTITTKMTDQKMVASGDLSDITYNLTASKTAITLDNLVIDDISYNPYVDKAHISLSDLNYVSQTINGNLRKTTQKTSAGEVNYHLDFSDPSTLESFKMNGIMHGLEIISEAILPSDTDVDDANAMLKAGLNLSGKFKTKDGNFNLTSQGSDHSGTLNTASEGSQFNLSIGSKGIAYELEKTGVIINLLTTELPVPVSFSATKIASELLIPLTKSDKNQNFSIGITLNELAISDTIWSIFDPADQLPRTPINLVIDLTGIAEVMFDLFDSTQAEAFSMTENSLGNVKSLAIKQVELDAVGAHLSGEGNFRFDNSDLTTFKGFPRPEGNIDFTLVGANSLIEKLVSAGLLPKNQAMGARMMLGLITVPGDGEDTLKSQIVVTSKGHIVANGQRLR